MAGETRIGILLFEDAEELDWAGPWEVLSTWALGWPQDGVEVFTVAQHEGPVRCAKGLRVLADHTWDTAPGMDVLLVPGGSGTRAQVGNETVLDWVRGIAASGAIMTSVSTGALLLADAGLLDYRAATTHWSSLDALAAQGLEIRVQPDERFVDTGQVITSAGVTAGIDMALHLVARMRSVDRAKEVRRYIQYDPQPPV